MHKFFAIIKALFDGSTSIQFIDKTRVLRTPGDVTDLNHN
jgi:hypothetical protein